MKNLQEKATGAGRGLLQNYLNRHIQFAASDGETDDNGVLQNDDSAARSPFGTREYWDSLYQGNGDYPANEYQWYYGFQEYGKYVTQLIPRNSNVLLPGIGNDPIILDLLQKGYSTLTGTDYSEHAIERQQELLSYAYGNVDMVKLHCMDARKMPTDWNDKFDAIVEKGALDAIYLSGDGNFEKAVKEFERVLRPGGILINISGVVPGELRRDVFDEQQWEWVRDGSDDLKAGIFILKLLSS
ncbi:methyltransferase domain containing protein [Nitzschia inconspicua]|uniref:Methyltransferase domain containing protein n=1 Tax=Nitzschia inconspicua TaxID=303405 RepID=A0A9K3LVR2_9STRA|nr:methyltransferase domain containing protein [Nitzschia inconspicua]